MLKKLLKYEFKATARSILPLYAGLIVIAIVARILFSSSISSTNNIGTLAIAISIFIYGFIMAAIFVATFFIMIQRFHKNLLGDEGYLMHTLPVMPYKNILSKLVTSGVWSIVSCIIALLSILILVLNGDIINLFFSNIIPGIKDTFDYFGIMAYIVSFEVIILGLLQLIQFILRIYASISIGHLFNSSKILLSIAAFIAITTIEGFITSNFFIGFSHIFNSISSSSYNSLYSFNWVFIVSIIGELVYSAIYFFITNYILKNKLNLE